MATIQCLGCGKRIIERGEKCPHCDTPINGVPVDTKTKDSKKLTTCPACESPISKNAVSCPHCGEPIKKPKTIYADIPEKKKTSKWTWFFLILFILYAVGSVDSKKTTSTHHSSSNTPTKPKKVQRKTLKGGYFACTSEELFDEIITASVNKDNLAIGHLLSKGCVLTKSGVRISVIDFGFGTSKIRAYTGDESIILYTNTENIYY